MTKTLLRKKQISSNEGIRKRPNVRPTRFTTRGPTWGGRRKQSAGICPRPCVSSSNQWCRWRHVSNMTSSRWRKASARNTPTSAGRVVLKRTTDARFLFDLTQCNATVFRAALPGWKQDEPAWGHPRPRDSPVHPSPGIMRFWWWFTDLTRKF